MTKKQSAKSCILHLYVNLRTTCASGLRCPTSRRVYCEYCTKTVRQPILGGCCLYSFTNSSASFSSCMYRNACNSQQQTSATIKQQHRKCLRIYFHNYTYRVTLTTTAQQNTLTVISGPEHESFIKVTLSWCNSSTLNYKYTFVDHNSM